jgi:formate-dependent nitrite reductase membrane component NrfD
MTGELQVPMWAWWIVAYFFLGGVAGGAYFLSAMIELVGAPEDRPVARMGYYIAFPLVLVCAILLIVDLGQPLRFWHMVIYSKTFLPWVNWVSPMSVGAIALLLFGLFSFLSFLDALVETGRLPWAPLREKYGGRPRKLYAVLGGLFGFFLTAYTGQLVTTTQLPIWAGTPILGGLFAASGASTGMAAVALGVILSRDRLGFTWQKLRQVDIIAILVEMILLVAFLLLLGQTALPLFAGMSAALFIGGVIIIGLLLPLVLHFLVGRSADRHTGLLVAIAVLTLVGGFLLRTVIVMGGQGLL